MQLGMIGLGRMGANMVRRLQRGGHSAVVYDRDAANVASLVKEGATGAASLDEFCAKLTAPRAAWVMVPAGAPTEETVMALAARFSAGDVVVDGGNSYYKDDVRRARVFAAKGIHYLDAGTSGGVWGLERGYCLMVGGEKKAFDHLLPIWKTLAPGRGDIAPTPGRRPMPGTADEGYLYCGPSGAGHFVKMVHNGIEYGLMQAYAEGFAILRGKAGEFLPESERYKLDLADIAEVWRRGSVISSWLLDLAAIALADSPDLSEFSGFVDDSGEGRWTINAAIEEAVPANVLSAALYARFRSRIAHGFGDKLLSALRAQFGGHIEGQLEKAAKAERKP
jgi:6-phosphogluconate dehydrogenase